MIIITEEPTKFSFGNLLKKEKKKEEPEIPPEPEIKIPLPDIEKSKEEWKKRKEFVPEIIQTVKSEEPISRSVVPEIIRKHPIVRDFEQMMDNEVEKTRLGEEIIAKIETLETNYALAFMQKLITIKNVLNYTQSTWSFGVCKEILDGVSIRGTQKKIASGLIQTIKKMAKLG